MYPFISNGSDKKKNAPNFIGSQSREVDFLFQHRGNRVRGLDGSVIFAPSVPLLFSCPVYKVRCSVPKKELATYCTQGRCFCLLGLSSTALPSLCLCYTAPCSSASGLAVWIVPLTPFTCFLKKYTVWSLFNEVQYHWSEGVLICDGGRKKI